MIKVQKPKFPIINCARPELVFYSLFFLLMSACGGNSGRPHGPANVVVARVVSETVVDSISVVGTLAANEEVTIQSEINGLIEAINFEEGQAAKKGDVLFVIDEKKLAATATEAEANFNLAQANLKRNQQLVKNNTISSQEYDQALSAFRAAQAALDRTKQLLEDATLTAPFDGIVGARRVSRGQFVAVGEQLTTIVNLDPLKAEFNVPERFAGALKNGLDINVGVAAFPNTKFNGAVYFISPRVEESTRTVLAKARIPNSEAQLKPGMLATVDLVLAERLSALVIPESALILQGEQASVFIANAEKKAELRNVQTGKRLHGGKVEIIEGLNPGELVVSEGLQKIGPGAELAFIEPSSEKDIRS